MTDRKRIAITVASALALGTAAVGGQWSIDGSGEAHVWNICGLVILGLALVGVFVVNRWWALLPGVGTVGVSLLAAVIYQPPDPWASESIPLTPVTAALALIFVGGFLAAILSLGLLARWVWDWFRRPKPSTTTPREIYR